MRNSTISTVFTLVVLLVAVYAKPHGGTKSKPHELTNRMAGNAGEHHYRGERATETSSMTVTNPTPHSKAEGDNGSPPELQLHHVTEHNVHKNQEDKISGSSNETVTSSQKVVTSTDTSSLSNSKPQNEDISIESEHLIHVTQKPAKLQKAQKNHKNASKPHGRRNNSGLLKAHHKAASLAAGNKKKPHHKTNSSAVGKFHHKHQQIAAKSSNIKVKTPSSHTPAGPKPKSHKSVKKYNSKKHGWKKAARKEKVAEKLKEKKERREKKAKAMIHHSIEKKN